MMPLKRWKLEISGIIVVDSAYIHPEDTKLEATYNV